MQPTFPIRIVQQPIGEFKVDLSMFMRRKEKKKKMNKKNNNNSKQDIGAIDD
jgi:hypothetical protein